MARKTEGREDTRPIRFQVTFDGQPDKPVNAAVYAFDARGQLLGRGAVRSGEATLKCDPDGS